MGVMRRLATLLAQVAVVAFGCAGCGSTSGVSAPRAAAQPTSASTGPSVPGGATIERVVDGDTIKVNIGGRSDRVRLIGIDTPESVKPNTPVQCFAHEASARTSSLLPKGTPVRLVRDVEARDRYGRLLAYVYRQRDGLFVNLSLVVDGYAASYTFPPNVAHVDEFVKAAGEARAAGKGLWSRCGGPHQPLP